MVACNTPGWLRAGARSLGLACILTLVSCITAHLPNYAPTLETRRTLRDLGPPALAVGQVDVSGEDPKGPESVTVRSAKLKPLEGSFATYLQNALVVELEGARCFDPASNLRLEATLLRNEASGGMSKGHALVEAELRLFEGDREIYRRQHVHRDDFESGVVGATAIEAGRLGSGRAFQGLVAKMLLDPDLHAALAGYAPGVGSPR